MFLPKFRSQPTPPQPNIFHQLSCKSFSSLNIASNMLSRFIFVNVSGWGEVPFEPHQERTRKSHFLGKAREEEEENYFCGKMGQVWTKMSENLCAEMPLSSSWGRRSGKVISLICPLLFTSFTLAAKLISFRSVCQKVEILARSSLIKRQRPRERRKRYKFI